MWKALRRPLSLLFFARTDICSPASREVMEGEAGGAQPLAPGFPQSSSGALGVGSGGCSLRWQPQPHRVPFRASVSPDCGMSHGWWRRTRPWGMPAPPPHRPGGAGSRATPIPHREPPVLATPLPQPGWLGRMGPMPCSVPEQAPSHHGDTQPLLTSAGPCQGGKYSLHPAFKAEKLRQGRM